MTLMTGRQRRCISRLAAAAASQLLQHSSCKRRHASPLPRRRRRVSVTSLHSVRWPQDLHIMLSTVQWKEGVSLNIGYLWAATYNLARWKFAYENRLVEIPRESREKIVYERCPNIQFWAQIMQICQLGWLCPRKGNFSVLQWNNSQHIHVIIRMIFYCYLVVLCVDWSLCPCDISRFIGGRTRVKSG